eukprot:COSAG02_NODE_45006_length_361_cov_0.637405_1_plen_26_part_01
MGGLPREGLVVAGRTREGVECDMAIF